MPLPPAPTKRAALLPPEAYDAPARSSHKAPRKTEANYTGSPLPEKPQALDFDPRKGGGELHPKAFKDPTDGYFDHQEPAVHRKRVAPEPSPRPARKAKPAGPSKL